MILHSTVSDFKGAFHIGARHTIAGWFFKFCDSRIHAMYLLAFPLVTLCIPLLAFLSSKVCFFPTGLEWRFLVLTWSCLLVCFDFELTLNQNEHVSVSINWFLLLLTGKGRDRRWDRERMSRQQSGPEARSKIPISNISAVLFVCISVRLPFCPSHHLPLLPFDRVYARVCPKKKKERGKIPTAACESVLEWKQQQLGTRGRCAARKRRFYIGKTKGGGGWSIFGLLAMHIKQVRCCICVMLVMYVTFLFFIWWRACRCGTALQVCTRIIPELRIFCASAGISAVSLTASGASRCVKDKHKVNACSRGSTTIHTKSQKSSVGPFHTSDRRAHDPCNAHRSIDYSFWCLHSLRFTMRTRSDTAPRIISTQ